MKRYIVFAFTTYYPGGGWNDFAGSFGTVEDARAAVPLTGDREHRQIIDTLTGQLVDGELE